MYSLSQLSSFSFSSSTSFFHRHHLSFHSLLLSGKEKYLLTFYLKCTSSSSQKRIKERERKRGRKKERRRRRAHHIGHLPPSPSFSQKEEREREEKVLSHPSLYQKRFHLTSFSSWYNLSHEGRRRQQAWPVERNALVISLSLFFILLSLILSFFSHSFHKKKSLLLRIFFPCNYNYIVSWCEKRNKVERRRQEREREKKKKSLSLYLPLLFFLSLSSFSEQRVKK